MAPPLGQREPTNDGLEAIREAQRIVFSPIVFQAAHVMRERGVLAALHEHRAKGITIEHLSEDTGVSPYGLRVLLEAGLFGGMIELKSGTPANGCWAITKTGFFLLKDEMTRVNMDFMQDVCYRAMFHLGESIDEGKPAGLGVFGQWPTFYEALSELPPKVRESWFGFDHYYSDGAFGDALGLVFADRPKLVLDVGGNTGKFSIRCAEANPDVHVTIADLPGQLADALANARERGLGSRITGHEIDLLDPEQELPQGFEVIWMSQFLCCFSEDQIVSILERAREAMGPETDLFILDTYWDRQRTDVASYCLVQTSLYFTAIANGNSRMYHSGDILECVRRAGLEVVAEHDKLGLSHTLFRCRRPS